MGDGGEAADLQKTGSNEEWKAKNIYDLTGNVWELTMEYGNLIGIFPLGSIYRGVDTMQVMGMIALQVLVGIIPQRLYLLVQVFV